MKHPISWLATSNKLFQRN